jgi:ADP-ribosylglycohydrolase
MRCSAIAIFTYPKTLEEMKIICEISTRLTHSHKWAIIGALQQCFALRQALQNTKSTRSFDFDSYFNSIITFVHDLERNYDSLDHFNSENIEMCSKSTQKSFLMYMEQKNELYKHKKKSNGHHKHHHHHHHHQPIQNHK